MDIEGDELDALPEWIESVALEIVFSSQELCLTAFYIFAWVTQPISFIFIIFFVSFIFVISFIYFIFFIFFNFFTYTTYTTKLHSLKHFLR